MMLRGTSDYRTADYRIGLRGHCEVGA